MSDRTRNVSLERLTYTAVYPVNAGIDTVSFAMKRSLCLLEGRLIGELSA